MYMETHKYGLARRRWLLQGKAHVLSACGVRTSLVHIIMSIVCLPRLDIVTGALWHIGPGAVVLRGPPQGVPQRLAHALRRFDGALFRFGYLTLRKRHGQDPILEIRGGFLSLDRHRQRNSAREGAIA